MVRQDLDPSALLMLASRLTPVLLLVLVACFSCARSPVLLAQHRTAYPSQAQIGKRETAFTAEMHERFRSESDLRSTRGGHKPEPVQKTVERLYR